MFTLVIFISTFYRAIPTSCSFSLKAVKMLPPLVSGWMGGFGTAPVSSLVRMFMHQIAALCESPLSRHKLNLGLMCAGSPVCACSGGERGTTGGTERERVSERVRRSGEGAIFWFSTQALWSWKAVSVCVFKSIAKTRRKEIVLSTAWGLCWAYIFKPPLFRA